MTMLLLILLLSVTFFDLGIVFLPPFNDIKFALTPAGRSELKREGTVTRVKIDIDRVAAPSTLGAAFSTYVVWAITPEGVVDNLGEVDINGVKGQFSATTRFGQFGILITA